MQADILFTINTKAFTCLVPEDKIHGGMENNGRKV